MTMPRVVGSVMLLLSAAAGSWTPPPAWRSPRTGTATPAMLTVKPWQQREPPVMPRVAMQRVYISIAGLIGAGKTSLATALGEVLELPVYYEPVEDNQYLDDFYEDMAKYGFALQVHLLNKRFRQQQEIVWSEAGAVQDRTIYEDAIFARMLADGGLMDQRDYETYLSLFSCAPLASRCLGRWSRVVVWPLCILASAHQPDEKRIAPPSHRVGRWRTSCSGRTSLCTST